MSDPELDEDFLEWEGEMLEYDDDRRIQQLTSANRAWISVRPGSRDERALRAVLRLGNRLRRLLHLK